MKKKIAHFGAFDHDSYGDLLFPHLAEHFLPDFEITHVAPTEFPTGWADAKPVISVREAFRRTDWDGILIGGGDIIQPSDWDNAKWEKSFHVPFAALPSLWIGASFFAAKLGIPLAWNAPGVPAPFPGIFDATVKLALGAVDYLSVRDLQSRDNLSHYTQQSVGIVPDTALLVRSLWRQPQQGMYHVVSLSYGDVLTRSDDVCRAIEQMRNMEGGNSEILILPLTAWQCDQDKFEDDVKALNTGARILPRSTTLQEAAGLIAASRGYIGNSLHGFISAVSYGVPAVLVTPEKVRSSHKYSGFLNVLGLSADGHLAVTWGEAPDKLMGSSPAAVPSQIERQLRSHWKRIRIVFEGQAEGKKELWRRAVRLSHREADQLLLNGFFPEVFQKKTSAVILAERNNAEKLAAELVAEQTRFKDLDTLRQMEQSNAIRLDDELRAEQAKSRELIAQIQAEVAQSAALHNQLQTEQAQSAAIHVQLQSEVTQSAALHGQLQAEQAKSVVIHSQLQAEVAQSAALYKQLQVEHARAVDLNGQLRAEQEKFQGLNEHLQVEQARSEGLGIQLREEQAKSNELVTQVRQLRSTFSFLLVQKLKRYKIFLIIFRCFDASRRAVAFVCDGVQMILERAFKAVLSGLLVFRQQVRSAMLRAWIEPVFRKVIDHYFTNGLSSVRVHIPQLLKELSNPSSFSLFKLARLYYDLRSIGPDLKLSTRPAVREIPQGGSGRKLKILYVCGMFPATNHAGGLRLFDVISELSQRHEVDLFAVYSPARDKQYVEPVQKLVRDLCLTDEERIRLRDLINWLRNIKKDRAYYDVIQLEYCNAIPLAGGLKGYGKKIGFTFQECITRRFAVDLCNCISEGKGCSEAIEEFIASAKLETSISRKADFTTALTPADRDYIAKFGGVIPFIVPTGVSRLITEATAPKSDGYEYSVAFLGYFGHYPNGDAVRWYLNNVHPLVKNRVPDYKIVIIGDGNTEEFRRMAAEDPTVIFTGFVPEVAEFIHKAKICISPLVSGAGLRGKINQYSALGKPTVSTHIGLCGTPYIHEESVIHADSPEDFADGMIRLLSDPELYNKIRENCREVAEEHFNWPAQIKKLEAIYYENSNV